MERQQARQAHGRWQGEEKGQKEALLQALSRTVEHVGFRRRTRLQREEEGQEEAVLIPSAQLHKFASVAGIGGNSMSLARPTLQPCGASNPMGNLSGWPSSCWWAQGVIIR